jgi:hypothetical protein
MKKLLLILITFFCCSGFILYPNGTICCSQGTKTTQATTTATITNTEFGDDATHRTLLTFTASPVVMTNNAGVALYGGIGTTTTTAVYTFPKGLIQILGADCRGTLTLTTAGALATFASVSALGQVTAASDATLTGTEANILASTSSAAAVAKAAVVKNISLIAPAAPLDGTVTAIPMFLNFVVANDASNSTGVGTYTGTCTLTWSNYSQN